MTDDTTQVLIDELDDLLDAERDALIAGDLTAAASLVANKEKLFDALNDVTATEPKPVIQIQKKVLRNQRLLEGALKGIRRASAKLSALRRVRRQLETYGRDGQRHTIEGEVVHKVQKRA